MGRSCRPRLGGRTTQPSFKTSRGKGRGNHWTQAYLLHWFPGKIKQGDGGGEGNRETETDKKRHRDRDSERVKQRDRKDREPVKQR